MNAPTDEQLLARHLDGDSDAFRTLVERHSRELVQFAYRFTGSQAGAEDVVQDAFVQVHLAAKSFDPSRRFKPWLFTITANKARDRIRSRTRRREVPLDAQLRDGEDDGQSFADLLAGVAADPADESLAAEKEALVREVVDELPPHLTEVLVLAYFHQFPYRDIAETLGIPLGTVKSRLHAAVTQFGTRYHERSQDREDAS